MNLGFLPRGKIFWNSSLPFLIEKILERGEGKLTSSGGIAVYTGKYTGRIAKDKYTVSYPQIEEEIWWHEGNKPIGEGYAKKLFQKVKEYLSLQEELYIRDTFAGAEESSRISLRLISEVPIADLFAHHMFLRIPLEEPLKEVDFTIYHAPYIKIQKEDFSLRNDAFVVIDYIERAVYIGGTLYLGEIKKSIFTVMNYLLPKRGILSMHCSANIGEKEEDVALFFGLSGTGKTTLSSDPNRVLIGDDEHGWGEKGVFNIEGGCYAKLIRLDKEKEPEIYHAISQFGAILENVPLDEKTRDPLFLEDRITENTRGSYPLEFLKKYSSKKKASHPRYIFLLTADAFGVLPPVAKLSEEEVLFYFLCGYTAKVAGTEAGINTPQATFSACFSAPFLALPPLEYAKLFQKKIQTHQVEAYLINTGWVEGPYEEGYRIPLKYTRRILQAILKGELQKTSWKEEPFFQLKIPTECPGVPDKLLDPYRAWKDKKRYEESAHSLREKFIQTYQKLSSSS